jgi:hypothetical protein
MDLDRQYLAQVVSITTNSLRLSSEKIEVVGLMREAFLNCPSLEEYLKLMKKVTQFSKLAIKLHEIYNYLHQNKIDFLQISDRIRDHSDHIQNEMGHLLDTISLVEFKAAIAKIEGFANAAKEVEVATTQPLAPTLPSVPEPVIPPAHPVMDILEQKEESAKIKERFIFEEDVHPADELLFQNYEVSIMKPVKSLDALLKRMVDGEVNHDEYTHFARVMKYNSDLSEKFGTEIITNMHRIIGKTLLLIRNRELMPGKEVIEAIRACLIVIVALVKNKEVDITVYLNRADEFGQTIKSLKMKD